MLVKELLEELKRMNPESKIYLQSDPEGNSYDELYAVDGNCVYEDETIYSLAWSADDACMDENDWASLKRQPKCVVLAP